METRRGIRSGRRWSGGTLSLLAAAAAAAALSACGAALAEPPGPPARAAGASPTTATWKIAPSPTPAGAESAELLGVSCPSASSCVAVGNDGLPDGSGPLVEQWDGRRWQTAAGPPSSRSAPVSLLAVSCSSPTACVAVGDVPGAAAYGAPYSAVWEEGRWRRVGVPAPGGTGATLASVSCTSSSTCLAVGVHDVAAQGGGLVGETLAERWDGTGWTILPTPQPPAAGGGAGAWAGVPPGPASYQLTGVSCTSAEFCAAVGYVDDLVSIRSFAETWDGRAWRLAAGSGWPPVLSGVSCTSPRFCVAVGYAPAASAGAVERTVAALFDGERWSTQPMPPAPGPAEHRLQAVSCGSSQVCVAVGIEGYGDGPSSTLADSWDGRRWTVDTTPNPPTVKVEFPATAETWPAANVDQLAAVACAGAFDCMAVGGHVGAPGVGGTLVERWRPAPAS